MNEPFDLYGTGDEKGFRTDPQDAVNEPSAPDHNAVQEEAPAAPEQEAPAAPQYEAPQYEAPRYGSPDYRYTAPNYAAPPKKQRKPKKQHTALRITALALCCALLGSVCGGVAVGLILRDDSDRAATVQPTTPTSFENQSVRPVSSNTEALTPAQIYEKNVPAIVGIYNESLSNGYNVFGQRSTIASSGTGFIISSDGEILTNYHVVENAQTLTVTLHDGTQYPATVLGYEAESDIALIKIDASGLPTVTLGDSSSLAVGDEVVAIGNPLGELTYSLTVGYVSAKERAVNTDGTPINMMQLDATINSGNSGGPLFDICGNVVGIISAKYSGSTSSGTSIEGIGFAIPIDDVTAIMDDLRQYGAVQNRAFMGIYGSSISSSDADNYGLPMGVLVSSVQNGSCAEKAGLQRRDILTGIGGVTISSYEDLSRELKKYRAGDETTLTVYRSGQTVELTIVFDAKQTDSTQTQPSEQDEQTATEQQTPWGNFGDIWDYLP